MSYCPKDVAAMRVTRPHCRPFCSLRSSGLKSMCQKESEDRTEPNPELRFNNSPCPQLFPFTASSLIHQNSIPSHNIRELIELTGFSFEEKIDDRKHQGCSEREH